MRPAAHRDRPHVVYRVYGRRGVLLYVGATHDLKKRLTTHRAERSPWVRLAVRITVEDFPDQASAYAAEKEAIASEWPVLNIQGKGEWAPGQVFEPLIERHVTSEERAA